MAKLSHEGVDEAIYPEGSPTTAHTRKMKLRKKAGVSVARSSGSEGPGRDACINAAKLLPPRHHGSEAHTPGL